MILRHVRVVPCLVRRITAVSIQDLAMLRLDPIRLAGCTGTRLVRPTKNASNVEMTLLCLLAC